MSRPVRCADCGAQNPQLIEQVDLALLTDEILAGDHDEQPIAHVRERGTGE